MQTNFTAEQLAEPRIAEADKILRSCVHCGFCIATCPTYVLLGDERDSPRGRIYLIKDMLEGGKRPSAEVKTHIDRCLSCLSCMSTCPSGVDYMHLVDLARSRIHEHGRRGIRDRLSRWLIARIVPRAGRFRLALLAAQFARPLGGLFRAIGLRPLAEMLALAPRSLPRFAHFRGRRTHSGTVPRTGRVILMPGCAQQALRPDINDAAVRVMTRFGIEVVISEPRNCCGSLVQHMGREGEARAQAARSIADFHLAMGDGILDAIVLTASGCGTTVKDYGHMFARDMERWKEAAHVAGLAKDICEFLVSQDLGAPKRWSSLRVAYHPACSLQHGQGVDEAPRRLLEGAGFSVADIGERHLCCGSAGTYNIMQPDLAGALRDRKIAAIDAVKPDVIATGNIGCIAQLAPATDIPIVHTVELIDWAYGGPVPRGLEALKDRVSEVPESMRRTIVAERKRERGAA